MYQIIHNLFAFYLNGFTLNGDLKCKKNVRLRDAECFYEL